MIRTLNGITVVDYGIWETKSADFVKSAEITYTDEELLGELLSINNSAFKKGDKLFFNYTRFKDTRIEFKKKKIYKINDDLSKIFEEVVNSIEKSYYPLNHNFKMLPKLIDNIIKIQDFHSLWWEDDFDEDLYPKKLFIYQAVTVSLYFSIKEKKFYLDLSDYDLEIENTVNGDVTFYNDFESQCKEISKINEELLELSAEKVKNIEIKLTPVEYAIQVISDRREDIIFELTEAEKPCCGIVYFGCSGKEVYIPQILDYGYELTSSKSMKEICIVFSESCMKHYFDELVYNFKAKRIYGVEQD